MQNTKSEIHTVVVVEDAFIALTRGKVSIPVERTASALTGGRPHALGLTLQACVSSRGPFVIQHSSLHLYSCQPSLLLPCHCFY